MKTLEGRVASEREEMSERTRVAETSAAELSAQLAKVESQLADRVNRMEHLEEFFKELEELRELKEVRRGRRGRGRKGLSVRTRD